MCESCLIFHVDSLHFHWRRFIGSKSQPGQIVPVLALFLALLTIAGCSHRFTLDTTPLDTAGMNYDAVQQLKSMNITSAEVADIATARRSGFSDAGCLEVTRAYHSANEPFNVGDTVGNLVRAGIDEKTIIELAKLDQLGLGAGELEAMHLAGLSDSVILEVARHHADGKSVFSGASLAGLKNAGLRDSTLLELARRGVSDSQTDAIVSLRRRGANDAEILRRFTGS